MQTVSDLQMWIEYILIGIYFIYTLWHVQNVWDLVGKAFVWFLIVYIIMLVVALIGQMDSSNNLPISAIEPSFGGCAILIIFAYSFYANFLAAIDNNKDKVSAKLNQAKYYNVTDKIPQEKRSHNRDGIIYYEE